MASRSAFSIFSTRRATGSDLDPVDHGPKVIRFPLQDLPPTDLHLGHPCAYLPTQAPGNMTVVEAR